MTVTRVYLFSGLFHKYFGVESRDLVREVRLILPNSCVSDFYPNYRDWVTVPGAHSDSVEKLIAHIGADANGSDRQLMIGFSSGGYLAILLGNLLDATHILAYSPPTQLMKVNLGNLSNPLLIEPKYRDLKKVCTGLPKTLLVADESQQGRRNSHHPRQINRLRGVKNLEISRCAKLDFEKEYFPQGGFEQDLRRLLSD